MRDAAVWGTGSIGGHAGRDLRHGLRVHGRLDGRGRRREGHPRRRARPREPRVPLIVVSASGGARMQEGTLALMQLAKTLAALERLRAAGVPFISLLSDPTTGGVFASFAAVGDVNIAEPNALIGFAGARVAAGTIAAGAAGRLPARRVPVQPRLRRPGRGPARAARRADRACCACCPSRGDARRRWPTPPSGRRRRSGRCRSSRRSPTGSASWPAATAARARRAGRERARRPTAPARASPAIADAAVRRRLGARPAGPQPAPAADARVRRGDDRRLRRAPRRPAVRRRRGDGRRPRPARRPARRRHRPAEGRRHRREHPAQLRHAPPRGLPQGDADHGARRALRPAGRHLRRRPGRPSGPESEERGIAEAIARSIGAHDPPAHADRRGHHRRGRLGRGAGHRRRRRRHRPRERGLLGHQPRGLRRRSCGGPRTRRPRRPPRCG